MDKSNRLSSKDITIREMLILSYEYYSKKDDKAWRSKLDIKSARLNKRNNFKYNQKTHGWEQTGRDAKLTFMVKSDPVSYTRKDKLHFHYYPVVFLLHDVSKGIDSPFKWRTGSLMKPKFSRKGMSKDQRERIQEHNIKNGIQMQFFFELEFILKQFGLLFGVNWATYPPRITNPSGFPFFDKHAYFIATKIILPLIGRTGARLNQIWKNESK
jgi:hypothetical protein